MEILPVQNLAPARNEGAVLNPTISTDMLMETATK